MTIGPLMTNDIFYLVGCFGKVGYFPSLLIIVLVLYCSSYLLIIYDQIPKRNYLFCSLVINSIAISFNLADHYAILFNFIVINIFIKFIFTIKHLVSVSSISSFILTYLLISIENSLYSILYLLSYFSNLIGSVYSLVCTSAFHLTLVVLVLLY